MLCGAQCAVEAVYNSFVSSCLIAADAINNAAGFGFRGYDKNGVTRWDLISNLRIQQIEVCFWLFQKNLHALNCS